MDRYLHRLQHREYLHFFKGFLKNFALGIFIVFLSTWGGIYAEEENPKRAIDPNTQADNCGPYYIWYQTGPDSYSSPTAYVDLYSITFDIGDIVDDFDFVYFTGSRAALDANKDGVSDHSFYQINGNQLTWRPANGRMRITQRGCWSSTFNERCGYAMINIQPKGWFRNGSARIPVYAEKRCSPTGVDCSEKLLVFHEFSNCKVTTEALPDFIIRSEVEEKIDSASGMEIIMYHLTIENTTDGPRGTTLTNSITGETSVGRFFLNYFNVDCPQNGVCLVENISNDRFQIELSEIPPKKPIVVSYSIGVSKNDIPFGETSYFTGRTTLSTGGSSQISIGISGSGGGRPERPRQ